MFSLFSLSHFPRGLPAHHGVGTGGRLRALRVRSVTRRMGSLTLFGALLHGEPRPVRKPFLWKFSPGEGPSSCGRTFVCATSLLCPKPCLLEDPILFESLACGRSWLCAKSLILCVTLVWVTAGRTARGGQGGGGQEQSQRQREPARQRTRRGGGAAAPQREWRRGGGRRWDGAG